MFHFRSCQLLRAYLKIEARRDKAVGSEDNMKKYDMGKTCPFLV